MKAPVWLSLPILMASAIGLGYGCGNDNNGSTRLEVRASELAFDPGELNVTTGQEYRLRLVNAGNQLHDWTIEAIPATDVRASGGAEHTAEHGGSAPAATVRLHIAATAGESADLSFEPTAAGVYTFYCSVPGHRDAGMEGRLVVQQGSVRGSDDPRPDSEGSAARAPTTVRR